MEVEQGTSGMRDEETKETVHEGFKFNADAPEFVPRSHAPPTVQECCYYYGPWFNFAGDGGGGVCADWFYLVEGDIPRSPVADSNGRGSPKNAGNVNDALQKIVKQVEYQISEANLVSSDQMLKFMNKDPEGYVPIATIVSQKKVKSLGSNSFMLAKALRCSPKLDVSEDGKKVRSKTNFLTEREKEELQLRTVVVENLPDDCSRPKLENIFSTVGRVKNVKICNPKEPNTPRSYKNETLVSNKLHALVEYETADQAEKASEKLNDERNWRKGLRVRVMLRRSPRSVMRNRRGDHDSFNDNSDDDELLDESTIDSFKCQVTEEQHTDATRLGRIMRTKSLGRVKTRGGSAINNSRGVLSPTPRSASSILRSESSSKLLSPRRSAPMERMSRTMSFCPQMSSSNAVCELTRQHSQGPRMPDGTRGFTMGRGKPLSWEM